MIGVILMVAITVILAAVIATFVMNMGPEQSSPANANWDVTNDTSGTPWVWELAHEGGGAAAASEYVVSIDGTDYDLSGHGVSEFTAGDSMTIGDGSADITGEGNVTTIDEMQLIWEDPEGDQSQIIDTWEP